jgi:hypothetical protein
MRFIPRTSIVSGRAFGASSPEVIEPIRRIEINKAVGPMLVIS